MIVLLTLLTAAGSGSLFAQERWKVVSNDNGVRIYSRMVAGHEESEFKGITDINQPIEVVGAVLADVPAYTEWFFKCLEARKIPQISSTAYSFRVYIALDTPWPLWQRDIIYDVKIKIDTTSGKVVVRSKALPDPVVPDRKDHVRITDSELHWILEKIDMHHTRMIFIMRTDAGGSVGSYWSDLGCRKTIYHSLINLHGIAADPKYEALGRKLVQDYTRSY
ncbi:MAG: hypothetical protein JSW26_08025 [Desulfobacterales bacterium]|nr:MAG: hypothetical protein JSW26_08025 [Desulfobacterales bacterium]